ncbi:MAG: hypothetical protein MJ155_00385 [Candidatus Saccharibacteria bacterium]|nr:hypothetical protein [Candidatus Saccharibacteria bacterium]
MQTMQNLTSATVGMPSYVDLLYQQECEHIRDTVHITVSHSLKARDQEIYARTRKIHELEQGDPDDIHAYCNDVVNAEADIGLLLDAMATLKANMRAHDFPAHDRIRIRDDLKHVYFHARLDNAAANQLYGAIHAISCMK